MNINRDYLIINDVKKSNVKLDNGSMFFYITDKNTQNIFVNLVINVSNNDLIQKYANIENAEDYTLTMNIVKPSNAYKVVEGKLHDKEKAIFEFNLSEDCCDEIGTYRCELLTKCNINNHEEITTSNKLTYKVKSSVLNDLDDIVEAPEYPLVIQLFDKLSDIEQYEEDRRANELARQLAEEQRQTRFDELNVDIDNKMVDVENRISAKEQAVDKLIVDTKADIDEYKVAKDQEIDEYKTAKDTEINNAITNQDNKIDTAISDQNDRITVVENNVVAQNDKLDTLETKATTHEARITAVEAKNTEQDNRLDIAENRLANIGNDITNTMQPIIDEHTSRLEAIEAIDVAQNTRLDAIEVKNQQQDDRLLDIEKVNNRQDIDIKCLYGASQTIDITKEGNSIYLQNSNNGFAIIDEIQGNTMVNCNKEPDKEIILNGNINTQGYSNITLTEGVDGGLVDVVLEGNTLVNLENQLGRSLVGLTYVNGKYVANSSVNIDKTALKYKNKERLKIGSIYTVILTVTNTCNTDILFKSGYDISYARWDDVDTVKANSTKTLLFTKPYNDGLPQDYNALNFGTQQQGVSYEIDEKILILEGDWTNREIPPYFEGMKSVGECEDLEVVSSNSDGTLSSTQTLTHEPLRAVGDTKDKYVLIDGKWYIERNTKQVTFDGSDDEEYESHLYEGWVNITVDNLYKGKATSVVCDKYVCDPENSHNRRFNNTIGGVYEKYSDGTESQWIRIVTRDFSSFSKFKQYLQSDPVTVIYKLQTPTYEPIDYNPFEVYANTTHISNNSTIPCNMTIKNTGYNCLLKPNTTYTVSSNLGLNTVTTPSVLTEDCLRFYDTDTSTVTKMNNVTILEGDYTTGKPLPSHFSGIESAFEQEYDEEKGKYKVKVKVIGKNLFDISKIIVGEKADGKINRNYSCSQFIKTVPNTTYYLKNYNNYNFDGIVQYSRDKVDLKSNISFSYDKGKITTGNNCHYIKVQIFNLSWATFNCNVQLEQGTEATPYEPYKENYIEFYIDEPLRGIGDVKDRVYVKDDKVVVERNCGQRAYQDGDFGTYLTDKVNTVYQLAEPTYEEVEYNDVKLFIESFKNSTLFYNSNIPVISTINYTYSVPLVDAVAQTASITDEQDSMIIDLAAQCAVMEMMLM